ASILLSLALLAPPQEIQPAPIVEGAVAAAAGDTEEFDILHHVLDERQVQTPFGYVQLPEAGTWMLGPVDITPTKYVIFVWLIGLLVLAVFVPAGRAARRCHADGDCPRGGHNAIEAMVLF